MNRLIIKDIKALHHLDKSLAARAAQVLGLKMVAKALSTKDREALEEKKRNRENLQKNLSLIKEKLAKMGYALGDQIAEGGRYGAPFDIGNQKVLKITLDPAEAKATSKVKEYNLKHSVNVYKIFKFKGLEDFYFLEQERLLPINKLDKQIVTSLKRLLKYSKLPLSKYRKYSESFDLLKDPESLTLLKSSKGKFEHRVLGFLIKMIAEGKLTSKDLKVVVTQPSFTNQLFDTVNEFRQAGITKLDLHAGNVMRDSRGVIKLIDFGFRIQFLGGPA